MCFADPVEENVLKGTQQKERKESCRLSTERLDIKYPPHVRTQLIKQYFLQGTIS